MKLPTREDYYSVYAVNNKLNKYNIVMTSITADEEKALDNGHNISITRGNQTFVVFDKYIYFYGEIDFNTGSIDMEELAEEDWFDRYDGSAFWLPGKYDYKYHSAEIRNGKLTYFDTTKVDKILQYVHGKLGKPQRTIIFKNVYR